MDPGPERRPVDLLYPQRREAILNDQCVPEPLGCGRTIDFDAEGWTQTETDEYRISGLCDKCQATVFGSH